MNLKEEIRYDCIVESEEKGWKKLTNSKLYLVMVYKIQKNLSNKKSAKLPIAVKRGSLH